MTKNPLLPCRDCQQPAPLTLDYATTTLLPWWVQCDICERQGYAITMDLRGDT